MVVPSTVMVPPGVRVCPPMTYVVPDIAVNVVDPTVSRGALVMTGWAAGVRRLVCPLITIAVAPIARDIVVPAMVMTPPGVSIDEPTR
jgi:hypothetical protein